MESLNANLFKFKIPEKESESESECTDTGSDFSESESDVLKNLPIEVVRRVFALENLQDKRQEIEALFRKELAVLEKKYETLYEPLYEERKKIINGEREVTEEEYKDREVSYVSEEKDTSDLVKGIPNFWLNTLSRSQLSSLVFEDDHDALNYLINIKSDRIIDDESPKLIISFEFAPNPYFNNCYLTKTVVFNSTGNAVNEVIGDVIDWKADQNLCYSTEIKKLRSRSKPNVTSSVEEKVHKPSFFHFFSEIHSCDENHDHEHAHDEEDLEEEYGRMMADAEICSFFDKYVIPNAVDWYTCKAQESYYDSEEEYDSGSEDSGSE